MSNKFPQRKSPRLVDYDYSQEGAYFVTICVHRRHYLFGDVVEDEMTLSNMGEIAAERWLSIPEHYPDVDLDLYVIMPNHMHGIIVLTGRSDFKTFLGRVINAYKGAVTAQIRKQRGSKVAVWQGRYHDHVIRDVWDLNRVRQYILHNPSMWEKDTLFGNDG